MVPRLQVRDVYGYECNALVRMRVEVGIDCGRGVGIAVDDCGASKVQDRTQTPCKIMAIGLD